MKLQLNYCTGRLATINACIIKFEMLTVKKKKNYKISKEIFMLIDQFWAYHIWEKEK